jgi:predicted nucleotide-binding protein (sugar kinase/HSP70/actin superfamily)
MMHDTEPSVLEYDQIEAELKAFEDAERQRLGLDEAPVDHWVDRNPQMFTRAERPHTTILFGGLTMAHDQLVRAALAGLGYDMLPLDVPDTESLRFGKEFGNRAQCNPTYFTVGNLVKHLVHLRDREGMPVAEIIRTRVFFTAGACGPCRFGTYVTEYRKALRDAGFDGFRVLLFQQQGGLRQATGEDAGLEFSPRFFITLLKALIAGDVVNLIGYRIRPYEIEPGSTDRALDDCKRLLSEAFTRRGSLMRALWQSRRRLAQVRVNRLQPKPKVSIIGEFWAMTTEGDGNYQLQRFLEREGAEVDIQPVTAWLLYNIWEHSWDTKRRMTLRADDGGNFGLEGTNPRKKLALLALADKVLRASFATFARAIGLDGYHLADMDEIATISHQYYDNHLRGGEGHMEVGKLIQSVEQRKAHMVISVKPFGCMPSSGVSDGVQSLVTARHADAIFCAIETTGDGAVNVQSRVLMYLFKARQKAQQEYDALRQASGRSQEQLERLVQRRRYTRRGYADALFYPPHHVAGTASNVLIALDPRLEATVTKHSTATAASAAAGGAAAAPAARVDSAMATAAAVRARGPRPAGFRDGVIKLTPIDS